MFTAAFFILTPNSARADAEIDALRAEVRALEARIDALEKRKHPEQTAVAAPITAAGDSDRTLTQRVAAVEQQQAQAQTREAASAAVSVGSNGVVVTSPDRQYSVNLHGYVQADDRSFVDTGAAGHVGIGNTSTFLIRSARPIVDAKMTDYFDARLMMDFGRGQTNLLDAYGDFHPVPGSNLVSLRAGEFKSPVGLERWQPEQDVLFVERGQTTNLVPYRDIGLMAHGDLLPKQLEYELAVLNGAADLQANTGDADNTKDLAARLFAHPLRWMQNSWLQGLGIGIGGTYGVHRGTYTSSGANGALAAGYATVGQRTYFTYSASDFANGPQWRVNPQATYYNGPFSLLGEYVANDQEITRQTTRSITARLRNNAWEGIATYVLSGEDASFTGVHPAHDFDPKAGYWGAFELVARMSELNVDRKAFPLFADPSVSARSAHESTVGGTWYFNPAVKLNLDYSYTDFDGGNVRGTDRKDEQVVLSRIQLKF